MARPPFKPTEKDRLIVELGTGAGLTEDQLCTLVTQPGTRTAIAGKTLRKYFRRELDAGVATCNLRVSQSLFQKAVGDGPQSVTAAIFWLKVRAGWRTVERTELTGADGEPLDCGDAKAMLIRGLVPHAGPPGTSETDR